MGHRHFPGVYKIENTVFVNAGTVSDNKTRHGDVNSFNKITIQEDSISITVQRTDNTRFVHTFNRMHQHIFHDFGERRCRLVHISNSFISRSEKFQRPHFSKAVQTINSSGADLLIHCGGIVEEGIAGNYELAARMMKKITVPVFTAPAGRDINYLGYRLFPVYFGGFDKAHILENMVFQGISSSQYDSNVGIIGTTERHMLLEQFKQHPDKMKCLFLHHNVLPIPHSREKGLLEDSGDFLYDIINAKIDLVLTGTSSHPFAVRVNDTIVINANSISSVYTRSMGGNSFNMIDIYENVIVVYEVNSLWGIRKIIGMWNINGA